jgi:hypothetical protein
LKRDRSGNEEDMRHRFPLPSMPWFWIALIAITLLLAACPGGGKSGY